MEEEGSRVRLVRCPKCENLLPELPDFSVYQCGGCGAVLRGKNKGVVNDGLLEKSDEERGREGTENGVGVNLETASESESDGLELGRRKERAYSERTNDLINSSSSSRMEKSESVNNCDQTRSEAMNLGVDQGNGDGEVGYSNDSCRQSSKRPVSGWDRGVNTDRKRSENGNSYVESEVKEVKPSIGEFAGSLRSRPIMDDRGVERNGSVAFDGSGQGVEERRRFSRPSVLDEGPSNYWPGSFHGYAKQKRVHHDLDGPSRVENLELDRAVLLRKLDELKDQLSRSCDVTEKPRGRNPPPPPQPQPQPPPPSIHYYRNDSYLPEGPTSLYSVNVQPFARDKYVPEPLYCNLNHESIPYINNHHVLGMQDYYPPRRNVPNQFVGYDRSHPPQRLRRPPYPAPPEYLNQPYHDHFPGQNVDLNRRTLAPNRPEAFSHQPACSCLRCYKKNLQIVPKVPCPTGSSRSHTGPPNPLSSVRYEPQGYNSRGSNPPHTYSFTRQPQTRSSSDYDVGTGRLGHRHPKTVVVAHLSERACHPIAGGAPFLTCCSCFEVLKLPRKLMVTKKNQQKVRCGACSAIILIGLEKKGLAVSIPSQPEQVSAEVGSAETLTENLRSSCNQVNAGSSNSCSDDYDYCAYNFQLTDSELNVLSRDQQRLNSGESNKRRNHLSSPSSFSEDEQSPDSVIFRREISNSSELPQKDDVPVALPDSSHQKDPDNDSSNYVVSRYGMGNKSKRNGQENVILDRSTSQQNYVKDVSVATEMEVSFNELPDSGLSQDHADVSKKDRPRINKRNDSFLASLIKKSFKDFSKSSLSVETGKSNVFVNGQHISDRLVRKAEKMAGPIQPGNYWYDYRAGFWGVMGQPCIGIIPPFIEELDYPMPVNCSAGNTEVFVNGRELHQKDLDLLAGRGLATTRDKSYIVEISGRVLDEDTGEELDCLGKLAPTVERAKHGFGMKIPRALAQ